MWSGACHSSNRADAPAVVKRPKVRAPTATIPVEVDRHFGDVHAVHGSFDDHLGRELHARRDYAKPKERIPASMHRIPQLQSDIRVPNRRLRSRSARVCRSSD